MCFLYDEQALKHGQDFCGAIPEQLHTHYSAPFIKVLVSKYWPFSWRWFFPKRQPYFHRDHRILVINTYCSSNRLTIKIHHTFKIYHSFILVRFSPLFRTVMVVYFSGRIESISLVKWVGCFQELVQMMFWFSRSIMHIYWPQNMWLVV